MNTRTSTAAHAHTQSLDDFLNHSTRGGGGGFLSGWKKDGSIVVYLHPQLWSAPYWNHGIPRVAELTDKETKDKRLVVMTDRWGCHESEALLKRQNYREKDGTREYPPEVCPVCKLIEAVREAYLTGKIGWTDPVFKWEGDEGELVLLAGGIDNSFASKDLTREQLRELRAAGVKRDDSWKQNLKAKLNYLFCVVDEAHPEEGVQKTFEAKGLGEKLKKAVKDEIRRRKDRGNPVLNPYPFEWTYDETQSFDDKYDVLARSDDQPSAEILALLQGDPPNVDRDLEPGNCFSLRAELEAHYVGPEGAIDFDAIFAEAERRGLMTPPQETKDDTDEELDDEESESAEDVPRVKAEPAKAAMKPAAAKVSVVQIGPTSDAWKAPEKWRAPANVKGAEVHLNPPDEASDEDIAAVRAKVKAAGAVAVGTMVMCDHCDGTMTTLDPSCPTCGAEYDEAGTMVTRPCAAEECDAQVPLDGEGPRFICPKCAAIHEQGEADDEGRKGWAVVPKEEPPAAEAVPSRRRRPAAEVASSAGNAASTAPKAGEKRGVPFDQPATTKAAAKPGAARARA